MSERVVVLLLEDIQNSIESILDYTKDFTFECTAMTKKLGMQ